MREIGMKTATLHSHPCRGMVGLGVVALRNLASMGNVDEAASASTHEITRLLQAWGLGDIGALDRLTPLVYSELHRLAHRYMAGEKPGQTLQTTALIHELYLR